MTALRWVFQKHWHPEVRWYARLRAALLILSGYETEICGRCGGKVEMVWRAPDPVWWEFSGYPTDAGVLCVPCFHGRAKQMGASLYWESAVKEYPTCTGHPCAHQESMMIIAGHRDEYWERLKAVGAA